MIMKAKEKQVYLHYSVLIIMKYLRYLIVVYQVKMVVISVMKGIILWKIETKKVMLIIIVKLIKIVKILLCGITKMMLIVKIKEIKSANNYTSIY